MVGRVSECGVWSLGFGMGEKGGWRGGGWLVS